MGAVDRSFTCGPVGALAGGRVHGCGWAFMSTLAGSAALEPHPDIKWYILVGGPLAATQPTYGKGADTETP